MFEALGRGQDACTQASLVLWGTRVSMPTVLYKSHMAQFQGDIPERSFRRSASIFLKDGAKSGGGGGHSQGDIGVKGSLNNQANWPAE